MLPALQVDALLLRGNRRSRSFSARPTAPRRCASAPLMRTMAQHRISYCHRPMFDAQARRLSFSRRDTLSAKSQREEQIDGETRRRRYTGYRPIRKEVQRRQHTPMMSYAHDADARVV